MELTYYPYELKLRHAFTVSSYSRATTPGVQLKIKWENVEGYGEAAMPPYLGETVESVTSFLSRVNLNQFNDPFKLEEILAYVDAVETGNTAAKAAIDIALHDLVGKLLHAPWYKLWGLDKETTPFTTYTIGIDTREKLQEKVLEVADRFRILKVKLGSGRDKEIVKAIREVSDLPLAVDANQGWKDKYEALDMINWLQEQGVVMIEQPIPKEQWEDIGWITSRTSLPVYADESVQRVKDIAKLQGIFTGINIKLMKCTGMREAMKMITVARTLGMQVMLYLISKLTQSNLNFIIWN